MPTFDKSISLHLYLRLLQRLGLSMLLFSVCRLLFFVLNTSIFTDVNLVQYLYMALGGLKFDLVAVLYTNILFILLWIIPFQFRYHNTYQTILKYIFIVTNSIALAFNCIDIVYFRFTLRRTTWSIFQEFSHESSAGKLLKAFFLDYWYIVLLFLLLLIWLFYSYKKPLKQPQNFASWYLYYPIGTLLMALLIGLFIAGVRGGFRHSTRPITLSNAGDFAQKPIHTAIVLNTPFSIMKTI